MYAYIIYRRLVSWTSTHVHICTAFQRVNVAVSIQTYTIYTPGTCINRSSSACLAFINTTHTHIRNMHTGWRNSDCVFSAVGADRLPEPGICCPLRDCGTRNQRRKLLD